MPKQSPVPDDLDGPFWEACNEERLVLQHCGVCDRFQHPPRRNCRDCGNSHGLTWRQIDGTGRVYSYAVVYDTPVATLQRDQPFNVAVIELMDAPGINMLSHLPGAAVGEVPIGAMAQLIFERTPGTGQKVPEWRIADAENAPYGKGRH